jgi:hypothetical protein
MEIGFELEDAFNKAREENERAIEANRSGDSQGYVRALARRDHYLREAALSAKARGKLPSSAFVYPDKKAYPVHDRRHAANALARSSGKPEEATVKAAVCKRYPDLPACQED